MSIIVSEDQSQIVINDHTGVRIFHMQKNSSLTIYDIVLEGAEVNSSLEVILEGEGVSVEIIGLFFGSESQKFSISHTIRHRASHTTSKMIVKGTLDDNAKASYNGLIEIAKGAVGCSGEQSEHTLLLSDKAHIEAVPALEIGNNEVKASHSVSTTYIDELKKFYLESRGLNEEEAVREIVRGHFSDVLEKVADKKLRIKIENKIAEKLKKISNSPNI